MLRLCLGRPFSVLGSTPSSNFKTLFNAVPPWVNEQMYSVLEVLQDAIATSKQINL
jgi:hypothetical protein